MCKPVQSSLTRSGLHAQEDEYGRARVHAQWGDEEDAIREAVDMCPVGAVCMGTCKWQCAPAQHIFTCIHRFEHALNVSAAVMMRGHCLSMMPAAGFCRWTA